MNHIARVMLLALCARCAARSSAPPAECGARPPLDLGFAVSHVAGAYPSGDAQLTAGVAAIERLGARTIKLYVTPNYADKYRERWPEGVHTLADLAKTEPYQNALGRPFRTFVLTTYSFANGVAGGFIDGFDELEAKAEYAEVRAFAEHLLQAYRGSGKRFVLQNWEGDWAARGGFEQSHAPSASALDGIRRYIAARQAAVSDARAAIGEDGVRVDNALEVNALMVRPGNEHIVAASVLGALCVDAVSYSSWEALAPLYEGDLDKSAANLQTAIARLRQLSGGKSNVYLGELGIAENDLPAKLKPKVKDIIAALRKAEAPIVWWQIFDNECDKKDGVLRCRGYGLLRPDGNKSSVLEALGK